MKIISYTKKVSIAKFGLGVFLGVYALFMLLTFSLGYQPIFFIGVSLVLLMREGAEIDITNKTFREFKSLFGFKFGKWKPIPDFEYVSVFRTNETQAIQGRSASTSVKSEVILLNLFYNRNRHITFYKTDNKKDAFDVAEHFKLALGIDILDATESEKKWL